MFSPEAEYHTSTELFLNEALDSVMIQLGAIHKRRPHKIAKNYPLPF